MATFRTFTPGLAVNLDMVARAQSTGHGTVNLLSPDGTVVAEVPSEEWDSFMKTPTATHELERILRSFTERLASVVGRIPTSVRMHY